MAKKTTTTPKATKAAPAPIPAPAPLPVEPPKAAAKKKAAGSKPAPPAPAAPAANNGSTGPSKAVRTARKVVKAAKSVAKTVAEEAVAVISQVAAPRKARTASASPRKRKPAEITISHDDIALRAYFIAERRRNEGRHGDPSHDWVEAERQLRAEATAAAEKN